MNTLAHLGAVVALLWLAQWIWLTVQEPILAVAVLIIAVLWLPVTWFGIEDDKEILS